MAVRSRTRIVWGPSGLAVRSGVPYGHGPVFEVHEHVVDDTAPGDNLSFKMDRYTYLGGRCHLAGNHDGVGGYGSFYNFLADGFRGLIMSNGLSHLSLPGDKGDFAYSTIAAARTNPSRPNVDVPVNVLQLGELTTLIRDSGRSLFRRLGNENLRYQFAIRPLVTDLIKLTQLRDYVVKRTKELVRLQSGRGLRRTIALGSMDNLEAINDYPGDLCQTVYREFESGPYIYRTRLEVGAHVRWKPDLTAMPYTDEAMHAIAKKAVMGLTVDISTLWELLPWSWMIDWGTTYGHYFAAKRDLVQAYPSEISVLRRTRTWWQTQGWSADYDGYNRRVEPLNVLYESKVRNRVDVVGPTAYMPFLSANQMGIVASLAVTRA